VKITRDVVSDLWPVYEAGEASADTRALIDEFLAGDPEFASTLRGRFAMPGVAVPVPPGAETRALKRTRDLVRGNAWLRAIRLVALVMTALTIKRVIESTSWTTSPGVAIGDAIITLAAWSIYIGWVARERRRALR